MTQMNQTPVHEAHNQELLSLIPPHLEKVIEIGCSSGALAREYKKQSPDCTYIGIDIDPDYAKLATRHCNEAFSADIELMPDSFFADRKDCQAWVFGDTLEHLKDPWRILRLIRDNLPTDGCVVACIPNAQHWTLIARLCCGEFRYESQGLLDRTHLRWFTRKTIIDLFESSGFRIDAGIPRTFEEKDREQFLPIIGEMAELAGFQPEEAIQDAMPLQFVIRARPA